MTKNYNTVLRPDLCYNLLMIELLSPAQNKECAFAAIKYGADAVYIGASCFGARKNAPNNLADISEVVEFAHNFYAKVYVKINTILKQYFKK